VVGANVLREGWKVIFSSLNALMDAAVDPEEEEQIHRIILDHATGAIEAHDIRTRMAGPVTFIEFHLVVDGTMTVSESHAICDQIESALRTAIPNARTTIHVEPHNKKKDEGLTIG
jgi:divalent metal cation (Fe/Co/Zn/Cd) transporter